MITHNAGYFRRLAAFLIDLFVYLDVILVPLYILSLGFTSEYLPAILNTLTYIVLVILFGNLLYLVYQINFISTYGGTIGKLLLHMRITDQTSDKFLDTKTAFYRSYIGYAFSSQFFWAGFLRMINHPQNYGWHDELFNTRVVLTNKSTTGVFMLLALVALFLVLLYLIGGSISTSDLFDYLMNVFDNASLIPLD